MGTMTWFTIVAAALLTAYAEARFLHAGIYYGGHYSVCAPAAYIYGGYTYSQGYFYKDVTSYVQCANGVATIRKCAPGAANTPEASFTIGAYSYSPFCTVNLAAAEAEDTETE